MTPKRLERGWSAVCVVNKDNLPMTQLAALAQEQKQEPVAWIQPDHLQKARQAPFLCRVEPTKRMSDFVPIYTIPPAAQQAEPVAWRWKLGDSGWQLEDNRPNTTGHSDATVEPLYTHPPRRETEHEGLSDAWKCSCGANLYIDADGKPRSKANG
jgi:hypothetical protein